MPSFKSVSVTTASALGIVCLVLLGLLWLWDPVYGDEASPSANTPADWILLTVSILLPVAIVVLALGARRRRRGPAPETRPRFQFSLTSLLMATAALACLLGISHWDNDTVVGLRLLGFVVFLYLAVRRW
jgi:cytochrome bd-type quinol oxidase subunit 2